VPVFVVSLLLAGGVLAGWAAFRGNGGPAPAVAAEPAPPAVRPVRPARRHLAPAPLLASRYPLGRGIPFAGRAGIVVDDTGGTVIWARRAHRRLPVASTTKIMTAVVALEHLRPHDQITIARSVPRAAPFREGLRAGERVQAWKLFYGLLLYSGNDDALALAIGAAGSRGAFLALMNAKARALGLRDSHFTSPSGVVDRGNYMSAWDLASLARYAMWNPRFRAIVRTRIKRVQWPAPTFRKIYVNKNHLLVSYRGADGIKTGWTTIAKHCLVASAHRHGIHLIAVVIGSPDAYRDVRRLLNYGFARRG